MRWMLMLASGLSIYLHLSFLAWADPSAHYDPATGHISFGGLTGHLGVRIDSASGSLLSGAEEFEGQTTREFGIVNDQAPYFHEWGNIVGGLHGEHFFGGQIVEPGTNVYDLTFKVASPTGEITSLPLLCADPESPSCQPPPEPVVAPEPPVVEPEAPIIEPALPVEEPPVVQAPTEPKPPVEVSLIDEPPVVIDEPNEKSIVNDLDGIRIDLTNHFDPVEWFGFRENEFGVRFVDIRVFEIDVDLLTDSSIIAPSFYQTGYVDEVATEASAFAHDEMSRVLFADGQDAAVFTSAAASAVTQLPEPGTVVLAVCSLAALVSRRMRAE